MSSTVDRPHTNGKDVRRNPVALAAFGVVTAAAAAAFVPIGRQGVLSLLRVLKMPAALTADTPEANAILLAALLAFFLVLALLTRAHRRRDFVDFPISLAMLLASPATILLYWALSVALQDCNDSATGAFYVRRVFLERGAIPYVIVFASWTAVFSLLLQSREIRREGRLTKAHPDMRVFLQESASGGRWIDKPTYTVDDAKKYCEAFQKAPLNRYLDTSFARRMLQAFNRISLTRSSVGVDSLLNSMSATDAQVADASHRYLHFILFLLPALGFAGTILGLGRGLGGFEGVVSGAESARDLVIRMKPLLRHLGMAFDTTLLGLVGSVIISLGLTAVCKRIDQLLTRTDSESVAVIVDRLEYRDPSLEEAVNKLEAVCQQLGGKDLQERIADLGKTIGRANESVTCFDAAMTKANELVGKFSGSAQSLGQRVEEADQAWDRLGKTLKDEVPQALRDSIRSLSDESVKTLIHQGKEYMESAGGVAKSLWDVCKQYSEQMQKVGDVLEKTAEASGSGLLKKLEQVPKAVEGVEAVRGDLARLYKRMGSMPERQHEIREATQSAAGSPALTEGSAEQVAARQFAGARSRRGLIRRMCGLWRRDRRMDAAA